MPKLEEAQLADRFRLVPRAVSPSKWELLATPKKHPAHQSVRGESENGSRLGARPAQPGGRAGDGCDDAI